MYNLHNLNCLPDKLKSPFRDCFSCMSGRNKLSLEMNTTGRNGKFSKTQKQNCKSSVVDRKKHWKADLCLIKIEWHCKWHCKQHAGYEGRLGSNLLLVLNLGVEIIKVYVGLILLVSGLGPVVAVLALYVQCCKLWYCLRSTCHVPLMSCSAFQRLWKFKS